MGREDPAKTESLKAGTAGRRELHGFKLWLILGV